MSATGYLQIFAYASKARIPLEGVAIMITDQSSSAIAMGLTDKNGKYGPIPFVVPNKTDSLSPGQGQQSFLDVNIHARLENFEQIEAENVQIFAETLTIQNLEMIPLSELPQQWTKIELFNTPPQNL